MGQRMTYGMLAAVGGLAALGFGAYALWNSRQAKLKRAARYAGKVLYKAGSVLQSVATAG